MSDAPTSADAHLIDLSRTFPEESERNHLISFGASFLSGSDEDQTVRAGSLALEYYTHVLRKNKHRHRKLSPWQARLVAVALLTAACRERAARLDGSNRERMN